MYQYIGQKTSEAEQTLQKDDGHTYLINDGYYLPYYQPSNDPLKEKSDSLERFFERFLHHCEPSINIKRTDEQIEKMRLDYEGLPDDSERKRISGALLVGAIVRRCGKICKKVIKNLKDPAVAAAEEGDFSTIDAGDPDIHDAAPEAATAVSENRALKELLVKYMLYLTGNEKLLKCPNMRGDESYIAVDSSYVFDEAFTEIAKTALTTGNTSFAFYENRAGKISSAMKAIDSLTEGMKDMIHESLNHVELEAALDNYGKAAKVRVAIRGSDVGDPGQPIGNYDQGVVDYDVAKSQLKKAFLSNMRHEVAANYMAVVDGMIELREPLPKSVEKVKREIKSSLDWVLGRGQVTG